MSSINFDNPWLLLIAVPLIALFAVPFFIAVRKDNVNSHNVASGVIHVVMALLIAFTAAGTSIVTTVTETDVYVLADVSYSANRNLDLVDEYISDLSRTLPDNSRLGVVCFGKDYKLHVRLGERLKSVKESGVDDSATDISSALEYAGSLFRDGVIKRIVLISDGKATDESDSNLLKRQVDALADRKIHVDAIYLNDNLADDAREVQLSSVNFASTACLGREETASIDIQCSCPSDDSVESVVTLYRNGEEYDRKPAVLTKGKNTLSFALYTGEAGDYDYEAVIECSEDDNGYNNRLTFSQSVSDEFNVLLITEKESDYLAIRDLYGANVELDAYVGLKSVPVSVEDLCKYDEIVLADVDVTSLNNYEMFLESLDKTVSLFGKSLVTFGNMYVQGYSEGELKKLGELLPVRFGKSDEDPKLYTIVIDTSRSMEQLEKLDRAKEAAVNIVGMLSDDDMVSVVEFYGNPHTVQIPVPLSTDRQNVIDKINALKVTQGTNIGSGLRLALDSMRDGNYSEKRVMLISDGLNFTLDGTNEEECVREMRDYDIYVSSLDVGRGADKGTESMQAKNLLTRISTLGGGKYLDISTDENLASVIAGELPSDVNNIEGGISYINVSRSADDVLKGISVSEIANDNTFVDNYIFSRERDKVNIKTVLSVKYRKKTGRNIDAPLYAYWNCGRGKVASFTSSASGKWVSHLGAELREKLFKNIVDTNIPDEKINYPFTLSIETVGGYSDVTVSPSSISADIKAKIEITSPDGTVREGNMAFGTSTLNYTFTTPDAGKYKIKITYEHGKTFEVTRYLDISYSPEYDSFTLYDASALHKMVGSHGTVSEDGSLRIVNDDKEIGVYNMSLALPLLITCVVLYAVDIAVRKLKWEDIRSLFKRVKK